MSDNSPSYEERVNAVVSSMTQTEDGKWALPTDVTDEGLIFAANAERRRRDTQSAFTKAQQELSQVKKQSELLAQGWEAQFTSTLPADAQAELEELKATDPDAWRNKLNELETSRRQEFQATQEEITKRAAGESELDYRKRALADFVEANPTITLSDEVIANDIPPRITNKLAKGEVDFGTFLKECADYLAKGKVVAPPGSKAPGNINLSDVPGSSMPGKDGLEKAVTKAYKDEIY